MKRLWEGKADRELDYVSSMIFLVTRNSALFMRFPDSILIS
jgi:hypothetical protein